MKQPGHPPNAPDSGRQAGQATRPLLAGLLALLLLFAIGMGLSIHQLRTIAGMVGNLAQEEASGSAAIVTMMRVARERMLLMDQALDTPDAFERDAILLKFQQMEGEFGNARRRLLALPLSPEEHDLQARQHAHIQDLVAHFEQIADLARRDDLEGARQHLKNAATPAQTLLLDTLARWVELRQAQALEHANQVDHRQRNATGLTLVLGGIGALVALVVAYRIYRWNQRMLGELMAQAGLLRASLEEQHFRQRALDAHSIVSMTDASGRITYVNDKFCEVSGYSREELVGSTHRIVKSGHHPPAFFQTMWETIAAGRVWHGEVKNRAKDGHHYWVATTIVPMLDEQGLPMRYISVRTDISHIMQLEEEVRQANVVLESHVMERTRELEEAKQQLEQELMERNRTQAALQHSYDELKSLHGQLQETQQYLMQSEKLSAVGQLAAGMAHEINNPIGFIASNLGTLAQYQDTLSRLLDSYHQAEPALPDDARGSLARQRQEADLDFLLEDAQALLQETRGGVERVRRIVQDLRDFSSVDSSGQWQWADINQGLEATLNLLGERLSGAIEVRRELEPLPPVECKPAELNQVFFNLLDNALRAMPSGGRLTLRSGLDDGKVFIEVEDDGEGMTDAVRARIFEPFFTTRPVGQGAGLGLSLAYGVVQQHGGQIAVRSLVGIGSAFRVTLPLRQPEDQSRHEDPPIQQNGKGVVH